MIILTQSQLATLMQENNGINLKLERISLIPVNKEMFRKIITQLTSNRNAEYLH